MKDNKINVIYKGESLIELDFKEKTLIFREMSNLEKLCRLKDEEPLVLRSNHLYNQRVTYEKFKKILSLYKFHYAKLRN